MGPLWVIPLCLPFIIPEITFFLDVFTGQLISIHRFLGLKRVGSEERHRSLHQKGPCWEDHRILETDCWRVGWSVYIALILQNCIFPSGNWKKSSCLTGKWSINEPFCTTMFTLWNYRRIMCCLLMGFLWDRLEHIELRTVVTLYATDSWVSRSFHTLYTCVVLMKPSLLQFLHALNKATCRGNVLFWEKRMISSRISYKPALLCNV